MLPPKKPDPTKDEIEARFREYVEKAAQSLAQDWVRLLNRAYELGLCLFPDTDEDGTDYHIEYIVGQVGRTIDIEWFAGMQRWAVVKGDR